MRPRNVRVAPGLVPDETRVLGISTSRPAATPRPAPRRPWAHSVFLSILVRAARSVPLGISTCRPAAAPLSPSTTLRCAFSIFVRAARVRCARNIHVSPRGGAAIPLHDPSKAPLPPAPETDARGGDAAAEAAAPDADLGALRGEDGEVEARLAAAVLDLDPRALGAADAREEADDLRARPIHSVSTI